MELKMEEFFFARDILIMQCCVIISKVDYSSKILNYSIWSGRRRKKNLVMTFVGYEWLLTFKVEFEVKLIHLKITLK
jgi:hypothetical protein